MSGSIDENLSAYEAAVRAEDEACRAVDRCERELGAARERARMAGEARKLASSAAFRGPAGVVLLDDLDRDTLRGFRGSHRQNWLEGAAVGKLIDGVPLGDAERDLLLCFAGRHGDRWPRTCEALLRVLGA